ncbi:MAG: hypothetical protein JWL69_2760 [Phycisphaerales bacterium]|nr:hypothetical protein [Phycisphaerales bacterium]
MLCLAGVALGVAVVVAMDAAVDACVRSFGGAVQSLAERSTHSIFADDGTISDEAYIGLLQKKLSCPLAPVIDRSILINQDGQGIVARFIGVDVFSERTLRSFTQVQTSLDKAALRQFLTEPGSVVIADQLADRLHAVPGAALSLTVGGKRIEARVAGIIRPAGVARAQLDNLVLADLATAQELTDSIDKIDRIDTSLESAEQETALAAALPQGLSLRSTRQQSASLADLTRSYRLNLGALSLMASFVAVFIVYNSMLISVQQRVTSLGILRCLGASRWQLGGIYLAEAVAFSIVGGLIGVIGGWLLSRVLVGYVATTINDLYVALRPGPVTIGMGAFAKGMAVSVGSCLIGAFVPLLRAAGTPPVNAFRATARHQASRRAAVALLLVGVALLAGSWGVYLLPGESPTAGFVMTALVALGFALMCPWLTQVACFAVDHVARPLQLLPLRMAATGVGRSLGITGIAVAATMLAMGMNVGVRTMVSSFRGALDHWITRRFAADVFIGPELLVNHKIDATLDPRVEQWVRAQPETRRIVEYRARTVEFAGKPIMLVGTNVRDVLSTMAIKNLMAEAREFDPKTDAMISEPLAGRAKLGAGGIIEMRTPAGDRRFRVFGVFYDFGSERGQVMLDRSTYAAAWGDDAINSLHVTLAPGSQPQDVAGRWSAQLRRDFPVVASSFGEVRGEVLTVFDRTFKITEVLTWLAGGVAFCGMAGSLLALALARQRDYSLLAAVGMSDRQTAAWVLGQGVLIAWVSAAVACVSGTLLAYVLAYVIQYRSFGWSIPASPQPRFWVQDLALATLAAVVAAIYPVYRLRKSPPAASLRQE